MAAGTDTYTPGVRVLPLKAPPGHNGLGRKLNTSTPLGKIIMAKGWMLGDVASAAGPGTGLDPWRLSKYVGGKAEITAAHRQLLAHILSIPPEVL